MKLIAVTNDQLSTSHLVNTLIAIEAYVDGVILREKSKSKGELRLLIQALEKVQFDMKKVIIHANPHLVITENIENVQLPGQSESLTVLRQQFSTISFGKSVHSLEEAKAAEHEGAKYVLYGHIFATNCKADLAPRGTEKLQQMISSVNIPVYAIGGIQPKHVGELKNLNVAGIAVMSSIFNSENPEEAAKSYYEAIREGDDLYV